MIAHDKSLHLLAGAAAALLVYAIALTTIRDHAALAGLLAAVMIGAVKEAADRYANWRAAKRGQPPPHSVEFMDFVATAAGGGVIFATAQLPTWL